MDDDIKFSTLKKEGIEDVMKINSLSFSVPWSRSALESEMNNSLAFYAAAFKDSKVIGYGGMWVIIDEATITNIAVHPDFRNQHIGTRIMEELFKKCRLEGVKNIYLEVRKTNYTAQHLYKKFGFVKNGIRKKYYTDNLEDAIIMTKEF